MIHVVFSFTIIFQVQFLTPVSEKLENRAAWLSLISWQQRAGAESGCPLEKGNALHYRVPTTFYCFILDQLPSLNYCHDPS